MQDNSKLSATNLRKSRLLCRSRMSALYPSEAYFLSEPALTKLGQSQKAAAKKLFSEILNLDPDSDLAKQGVTTLGGSAQCDVGRLEYPWHRPELGSCSFPLQAFVTKWRHRPTARPCASIKDRNMDACRGGGDQQ